MTCTSLLYINNPLRYVVIEMMNRLGGVELLVAALNLGQGSGWVVVVT